MKNKGTSVQGRNPDCPPDAKADDRHSKSETLQMAHSNFRGKSDQLPDLPTSIDLFCGAGGITEGFRQAGFRCVYANDFNAWAIETFKANHPGVPVECKPIEEVDPKAIRHKLGMAVGELDVLVGGPPCQGFSINAPERFLEDPRNSLVRHYFRFVDEFQPKTLLIENVPGMLSLGHGVIYHGILNELEKRGYQAHAKILFAAHYGVPQQRWRMIILGSRISKAPEHPQPTHAAMGRANFTGGKTMTYRLGPLDMSVLKPPITVEQAIGDLPRLSVGEGEGIMDYDGIATSDFSSLMRGKSKTLYNHEAASLSKLNLERMKHVKPGGSWRDIPMELLPSGMRKARRSDHTKRYGRLEKDGLAGTIMTKCDPHWSAVFLPDQDRTLTVREAARIQSFPDAYRFLGPRVSQYEQVGNAVPVLMAKAIGATIVLSLGNTSKAELELGVHVA